MGTMFMERLSKKLSKKFLRIDTDFGIWYKE